METIEILQEECVYYFFIDKVYKKKPPIHNIIKNDFYIQNALTNSKKIENINKYKHYYYICENSSELKITEIYEDTLNIRTTRHIKKDDTILLKFEAKELTYLKHYLKSLSYSEIYIFTIIDYYKRLLKSISLLVNKQLVHNHINFETIVVDNQQTPLLSNFSFSFDISRTNDELYIKQLFVTYDPSYLEWPIEIHILSYLLSNNLKSISLYNLENIINSVSDNNILKSFGDSLVSSYKEEALKYFNKYVNQSYEYILSDILQYYNTWDNYSLSILFLRILIGIHRTIGIKNKFIILFMKLLVGNIHLNPLKRMSISSSNIQFESLIDSLEPKDYKEVIDNLFST